jgi:hypothetical protein
MLQVRQRRWSILLTFKKKRLQRVGTEAVILKDRQGRPAILIDPRRLAHIRSIFENQLKRGRVRRESRLQAAQ